MVARGRCTCSSGAAVCGRVRVCAACHHCHSPSSTARLHLDVFLFHRVVYHVFRHLLFCLCRWRWLKRIGMSLLLHKFIKLFRNKSTTNSSNKNKPSKINFAHNNINIEMITCKILFFFYVYDFCILVVCIFVLFKKLKLKKLKKLKIKIILKILKN